MLAALLVAGVLGSGGACAPLLLRAEISPDLRWVRGMVRCEQAHAGAVATYPRLLRRQRGLDDVTRPWLYPAGFSPADMRLWQAATPLVHDGAWQPLAGLPQSSIELRFETLIPERNGAFGRREGAAYLLGGWHPAFGDAGRPLRDTVIDFAVRVPEGTTGFVGTLPFGLTSPRLLRGRFEGRFLPVLVAPALEVKRGLHHVIVRPLAPATEELRDLTACKDETALDELASTLSQGESGAARHGFSGRPLLAVVGPSREQLAQRFDGGILVSDRAFHVPAFELFRRYHRLAVWRAQLGWLALAHARAVEVELPPELAADAVGVALRDKLGAEAYGRTRYVPELLAPIAVIPEIESLIYAPQIPLVDAYFDAVDERSGASRDLAGFATDLPRGKLLYEKLVAWVGAARAQAITLDYMRGDVPYLEVVRHAAGDDVVKSLETWLGPPPALNYTLSSVGSDAGHIEVTLAAHGADAARVREPLSVSIVDKNGMEHRARRVGAGTITIEAPGPPRRVELDPENRLVETLHAPGQSPRFDNREPARWRLLLNDITGLVAVTNHELTASADFSLRRVDDLTYRYDFRGVYAPDAYQLGGTWSFGSGEEVTPLSLAHRTGVALTAERLRVYHGNGEPGYELAATLFHRYDTRLSPYSAYTGQGFLASVTGASGVDRTGHSYQYLRATASLLGLLPLSSYHSWLGRLRGDIVLGDAPAQQLMPLGGRYTAARGYEPDEAYARRRVVLSFEDRHAWSVDTRSDLFGLVMVTGVEGALFADAVYLPVREPSCRRDLFFDAGYGLRFLVDLLDVSPSSLAIDMGVPLSRCPGGSRAPVTVYLAFVQSFATF